MDCYSVGKVFPVLLIKYPSLLKSIYLDALVTVQFLVSKLVACCIPSVANAEESCPPSSQVFSLLHLLTVDSDPSLHDYIRVSFSQPGAVRIKNFTT